MKLLDKQYMETPFYGVPRMTAYGEPEIVNTDQGSQFTSPIFTNLFDDRGTKLSMDGKGRCIDNSFIERFWRSLRYEKIYLEPSEDGE